MKINNAVLIGQEFYKAITLSDSNSLRSLLNDNVTSVWSRINHTDEKVEKETFKDKETFIRLLEREYLSNSTYIDPQRVSYLKVDARTLHCEVQMKMVIKNPDNHNQLETWAYNSFEKFDLTYDQEKGLQIAMITIVSEIKKAYTQSTSRIGF